MGEKKTNKSKVHDGEPLDPNSQMAYSLLNYVDDISLPSLTELYDRNHDEARMDSIEVKTKKDSYSILHMAELLVGNQDSAIDTYLGILEKVAALPEEMKPDTIVLSGIVQGDFKYIQKSRRKTLVPELTSMDKQFHYAKDMISAARKVAPVIYNMGNDDHRIAEEYTVEVFKKMQKLANQESKRLAAKEDVAGAQLGLNVSQLDKMKQHPQWNAHLQFQINTIFPHCLKLGRRLRTGEELKALTDGRIDIDEYFLLYEAAELTKKNQKIPKMHRDMLQLIEDEYANIDEGLYPLTITDDFNLQIKTKNAEYLDYVRHYLGFSGESLSKNHLGTPLKLLGQLASRGAVIPDMIVTQNNQETVGVSNQGAFAISIGGLIRASNFLNRQGSRADAKGDISRRLVTSKKQITEPSASMHTRTDEGNHIITFFNDALYEKMFSLPERMTIAGLCDLQHGSITARPDLLVKYLDYIRTRAIGERATALFFGGDMLHGRNYPNFPSESQLTGLMAMDSQEDFTMNIFRESLGDLNGEELEAIKSVLVQPGNHEWNSGTTKWHGYSFTTYMRAVFERMYARAGYSDEEIKKIIKSHEAVITAKGEYASGYTGVEYFGDIGVLIQHFLLEKGGGAGGLPVHQTDTFVTGAGELTKNIDILMQGHWHHPQYVLTGNKLGIVTGSIAGVSDYELKKGLRATIGGTLLHIGGGLPPQVEFISQEALNKYKIKTGGFSQAQLKAEGYTTDRDFDPVRHGIYIPRSPKSAIQKKVLSIQKDASERVGKISELK